MERVRKTERERYSGFLFSPFLSCRWLFTHHDGSLVLCSSIHDGLYESVHLAGRDRRFQPWYRDCRIASDRSWLRCTLRLLLLLLSLFLTPTSTSSRTSSITSSSILSIPVRGRISSIRSSIRRVRYDLCLCRFETLLDRYGVGLHHGRIDRSRLTREGRNRWLRRDGFGNERRRSLFLAESFNVAVICCCRNRRGWCSRCRGSRCCPVRLGRLWSDRACDAKERNKVRTESNESVCSSCEIKGSEKILESQPEPGSDLFTRMRVFWRTLLFALLSPPVFAGSGSLPAWT